MANGFEQAGAVREIAQTGAQYWRARAEAAETILAELYESHTLKASSSGKKVCQTCGQETPCDVERAVSRLVPARSMRDLLNGRGPIHGMRLVPIIGSRWPSI